MVLQDTTAPGYTEIPEWIMQGYTAMVDESLDESSAMPKPSHVLLQMGVPQPAISYFSVVQGLGFQVSGGGLGAMWILRSGLS